MSPLLACFVLCLHADIFQQTSHLASQKNFIIASQKLLCFLLLPCLQAMELSIATQNHPHFSEQAKEAFMKYTQSRTLSAKVVSS